MKKEITQILEQKLAFKSYKVEVIKFASDLIDFYESKREVATQKFERLLKKYNFETIPTFSEYEEYPQVTLFHGSGGLEFWPCIDYEGGITDTDEEIGTIVEEPEVYLQSDEFHESVRDEIEHFNYEFRHTIAILFLSTIWQNIEGHQSGIVVKTLENNSVREFIFNDLAWDDLSTFRSFNSKEIRVEKHFNRNLSIYELYQRVNLILHPVDPYRNTWRKFIKENNAIEIGSWGNEIAERVNDGELLISNKVNLLDRLKWEKQKSDELINDNYSEIYYEDHKEQIHKDAIEFPFVSGAWWYKKELEHRLHEQDILDFESELKIKLPFFFRHYLRLFNGRKFNKHNMNFAIDEKNDIKLEEFYNIEELKLKNEISTTWLAIARTEGFIELKIGVAEENNGKLQLDFPNGEKGDLEITFEELVNTAKY